MPNCKEMTELKDGETIARKLLRSRRPEDVKLMYGAWANESLRVQRSHWDHCSECQSGPVPDAAA